MKTYFVAYGGFEAPNPNHCPQWEFWIDRIFPLLKGTDIVVVCGGEIGLKYFSQRGATVRLLNNDDHGTRGYFDMDELIEYDKWQSYNWGPNKKSIETVKDEAKSWVNRWSQFFDTIEPDCQFVFHMPHISFRKVPEMLARERGIKCLYVNEYFDRAYLDEVGFSQRSSINYVWHNLKMRMLSPEQKHALALKISATIHKPRYSRIPHGKTAVQDLDSKEAIGIPKESKMLLQLEQYPFDGNKIIHNPLMKTKGEYISPVVEVIKNNPEWHLVVKKHPEDDWSQDHEFTDCFEGSDQCHFVNDINIHDLLKAADCVVVLNPMAGLEALTYKKPVITTADAIYAGKGFTWDVKSHSDYKQTVSSLLYKINVGEVVLDEHQKDNIDKFLYYLLFETGNGKWD